MRRRQKGEPIILDGKLVCAAAPLTVLVRAPRSPLGRTQSFPSPSALAAVGNARDAAMPQEGHRVACMEIEKGGALTSWGTAFGFANIDLHPGDYCCNLKVLKVLRARRSVTWDLPSEPTFDDMLLPKTNLDPAKFTPGAPTAKASPAGTFKGFARPGGAASGRRCGLKFWRI